MHNNEDLGAIRESVGEMRGEVRSIVATQIRLEQKIDLNQKSSTVAHRTLEQKINTLDTKITTHLARSSQTRSIADKIWTAGYTLVAGFVGAIVTWLMGTGGGSAHP